LPRKKVYESDAERYKAAYERRKAAREAEEARKEARRPKAPTAAELKGTTRGFHGKFQAHGAGGRFIKTTEEKPPTPMESLEAKRERLKGLQRERDLTTDPVRKAALTTEAFKLNERVNNDLLAEGRAVMMPWGPTEIAGAMASDYYRPLLMEQAEKDEAVAATLRYAGFDVEAEDFAKARGDQHEIPAPTERMPVQRPKKPTAPCVFKWWSSGEVYNPFFRRYIPLLSPECQHGKDWQSYTSEAEARAAHDKKYGGNSHG